MRPKFRQNIADWTDAAQRPQELIRGEKVGMRPQSPIKTETRHSAPLGVETRADKLVNKTYRRLAGDVASVAQVRDRAA